jgi:Redoxin
MILRLALVLLCGGCIGYGAESSTMMPVVEHGGRTFVRAVDLERDAHFAVTTLPGNDAIVVCAGGRCALVKDYVRTGDQISVSTSALAAALGLRPRFSADRKSVSLSLAAQPVDGDRLPRVGELAPNFRIPLLDGGTVSLSEFRGKRVLINSWASW